VLLQDLERDAKGHGRAVARGVRFYLDDFGTGYSTFQRTGLAFECIQAGQSLLGCLPEDRRADMLVHTLLECCSTKWAAGGGGRAMETAAQAEGLRRYDADWLQGYYYARPLPEERLLSFLLDRSLTEAR
jgi:EAL domain-containing protein (putative c-di-GMP-specific phosphodiesterase class I)